MSQLTAHGLFDLVYKRFAVIGNPKKIKTPQREREPSISLVDCLMSGLAIFSLKYPSLLEFEEDKKVKKTLRHNLKMLFQVNQAPCDTQLRERLNEVEPSGIRQSFKTIFAYLQRRKMLKPYEYLGGYLLSLDGTGYFSSQEIHCENCCEKHHKDGSTTYYHQMLGVVMVHPNQKVVIPFAPEPIMKQDGQNKNDCERNAARRLLENFRREHPHLKVIITEDGLSSNAPHIETLKALNCSYILGVKPGDHRFLFEHEEVIDDSRTTHRFKFINNAPLNEANFDCKINFL